MGKRLTNIMHDFRVYHLNLRTHFRAAAMLRGAFITQVLGMVANNVFIFGAWLLFFDHFGTLNGWGGADFIGLAGVNALVYGAVSFLSIGLTDIPRLVDTGSLDNFLTKPTSVLSNIASSNVDVTTLGDMAFGIVVVGWYMVHTSVAPAALVLFLVSLISAAILFFCFVLLLPFILSFYLFDSEKISRYVGVLFLDAGFYPVGILSGSLRTVLLLVLPAILYSSVPVDILRGLNWQWAGLGLLVALFWLTVTLWLFQRALRRYESANLIGAR